MTEMRQIVNRKLARPRQSTPEAPDGAQASPDVIIDHMAASTHLNSAVCLPLVSESKKLLWVESHQIDLQLDGAAELNKAFDRFPYLTDKQTAALAQRCLLHPDQVKVWFMAQRLRYGVSWDYKDIHNVRHKFKFSQGDAEVTKELHKEMKEGFSKDRQNEKQEKEKVKECGGKKTEGEQSEKEKETTEQHVATNKQLERNAKQEQLKMQEKNRKVAEDKISTLKKRKRVAVMGKRKKKRGHNDEGIIERAAKVAVKSEKDEHREQKHTKLVGGCCTKKNKRAKEKLNIIQESSAPENSFLLDFPLDISSLFIIKPQSQTLNTIPLNDNHTDLMDRADGPHDTPNIPVILINSSFEGVRKLETGLGEDPQTSHMVTDVDKLKELTRVDERLPVASDLPTFTQLQDDHLLPIRSFYHAKTKAQVAMLRKAFLNCQYPSRDYYGQLEVLIGLSRHVLVQWFGDMRYYIKKSKPHWMSGEQHRQALATVLYYQCKKTLATHHQTSNDECTTKMMTFEGSRSCEEEESVKE
ncbi:homeobox and leucine zipper encoding b isoform X2 [Melanotaenia boesemani]|nr:homeobox and leucine zipper encoding b isoform X2 [Melanotaenia boesemani]